MSAQFDITIRDHAIGGEALPCVDARQLHAAIQARKDFSTWIKDRIQRFKFVENKDFIVCSPNLGSKKTGRGGHNAIEYILTLDTAKELAMVENNDRGRAVRRYFIEAEKMLRQVQPAQPAQPALPPAALQATAASQPKDRLDVALDALQMLLARANDIDTRLLRVEIRQLGYQP